MPPLTALLHTENDALRLGRCLETLYPVDDIVIVDHGSRDATAQVAREYGAQVVPAVAGAPPDHYFRHVASRHIASRQIAGWILCLDPRESLTESLAATLYEWKAQSTEPAASGFSVFLREETAEGWIEIPAAQTRLVPHAWNGWQGKLPENDPSAVAMEGNLLRFSFP